jgi:anti-sigma regulatory factor (Ser/Thr protein kinase)
VLDVLRRAPVARTDVTAVAEVAALLTSELATNAVRHARSPFEVRVEVLDCCLRVAVEDDDPRPPARREASLADTNGRGIMLVDTLADAWGMERAGDGKRVWFQVSWAGASRGALSR